MNKPRVKDGNPSFSTRRNSALLKFDLGIIIFNRAVSLLSNLVEVCLQDHVAYGSLTSLYWYRKLHIELSLFQYVSIYAVSLSLTHTLTHSISLSFSLLIFPIFPIVNFFNFFPFLSFWKKFIKKHKVGKKAEKVRTYLPTVMFLKSCRYKVEIKTCSSIYKSAGLQRPTKLSTFFFFVSLVILIYN